MNPFLARVSNSLNPLICHSRKRSNVIDDKLRRPTDNPTIGIILCRSKKKSIVEYALRGMNQPIGVSTYRTTATLPDEFKARLPSIEDLQHEIEAVAAVIEEFDQSADLT